MVARRPQPEDANDGETGEGADAADGRMQSGTARLERLGFLPWLLFLVGYTALISAQRWLIDREIIDRYWVPYVVVGVIVVARTIAETGILGDRKWRAVVVAVAGAFGMVNLGLVLAFAATRADSGIELNETRYQGAELFDQVADAGVEVVLTDSVRLVELHVVALGDTNVDVRDIGCRWSGESDVVAMAEAATRPTAVLLAGFCDREAATTELASIDGSEVFTEPGVGTLVVLGGRSTDPRLAG